MRARLHRGLVSALVPAVAAAALAGPARGEVVEASSTTMLSAGVRARDGVEYRLVPAYEVLTLVASDFALPVEGMRVVVSAWGNLDLGGNLQWDNGALRESRATGDLDLAYVEGGFGKGLVRLRLGRFLAAGGTSRMLHLDGGQLGVRRSVGPVSLGLTGYVGSPVTQRFGPRGDLEGYNPARATVATGGRVFASLPRWFEVGGSIAWETNAGQPSRRDVGGDLRVTPRQDLDLLASAFYSLYESRWGEFAVQAAYRPVPKLQVWVDYRHVEPDLFLSRDSILSVFAADKRNEVGGAVAAGPWHGVTVSADYHYLGEEGDRSGSRGRLRGVWRPLAETAVGVEGLWLDQPENSTLGARLFGSQRIDRFRLTADVQVHGFDQPVNGEKTSVVASGTVGYQLSRDLYAQLAGSGGTTPYLEGYFGAMAKLVYNPSFQLREVR